MRLGPSRTQSRPSPQDPPTHYLQAWESMVPLLSFDPWWTLEGKYRLSPRAKTGVGGQWRCGSGGGKGGNTYHRSLDSSALGPW